MHNLSYISLLTAHRLPSKLAAFLPYCFIMKKIAYTLAFLLAGAFMLTGCVVDNSNYPTPQPQQPVGYQNEFYEDFVRDDLGWEFSDPYDSAYAYLENGLYNFVDYSWAGGFHTAVVGTGAPTNYDFLIQTRMRSDYGIALVFGASNTEFGYSFYIDKEGYFAMYNEGNANTGLQTILDWQYSNAINPNAWNDIELEQIGSRWIGYANGTQIFDIPAQYMSGNQTGFMVLAGTHGMADYLRVQW